MIHMCAAVFSKPTSMLQKYVEQTQEKGKRKLILTEISSDRSTSMTYLSLSRSYGWAEISLRRLAEYTSFLSVVLFDIMRLVEQGINNYIIPYEFKQMVRIYDDTRMEKITEGRVRYVR